jgi:histidinol-phosphate aminotransferase
MYQLNEKIRDLKPYDPITGYYPIRLDANESFIQVPGSILSKIQRAVTEVPYNRYPDPYAVELCESFASFYHVNPKNVTAGNGSDELISVLCNAFLMKGETVMTVSPDFSMYHFYSSIVEANCIQYEKEPDLTIDVDEMIAKAEKNNVRMIVFSNPCNPTSLGLKREDVRHLISSVNALVVLDEAYMDFWDQSLLEEVENYDNLIILKTCSKAFGMAGIRLGFAVANRTITQAIQAVKSPYNVNLLTQKIGSIVLQEKELISSGIDEILKSKNDLYSELKRIEGNSPDRMHVYESVTNFIFIKMKDSKRMFESLLSAGIAIRYMGEYIRITAGTEKENAELIKAFERFI